MTQTTSTSRSRSVYLAAERKAIRLLGLLPISYPSWSSDPRTNVRRVARVIYALAR